MNILNKICCLLMAFLIFLNLGNILFYEVNAATGLSTMMDQASGFITTGEGEATELESAMGDVTAEFKPIGQLLTMIGAGVMIAVTTYMGIKYLTSGPETQAKLKQQLIGVIVSGIVIFGAYGIWSLTLDIVKNFD